MALPSPEIRAALGTFRASLGSVSNCRGEVLPPSLAAESTRDLYGLSLIRITASTTKKIKTSGSLAQGGIRSTREWYGGEVSSYN
jgi:hypothetical protein